MCMIVFKQNDEQIQPIIETINSVIDLYTSDPISFYYVDVNTYPRFHETFESQKAIIYRSSSKKYAVYDKPGFSQNEIKSFVDNIISGNGRFKRLKQDLEMVKRSDDL